ncbi:ABC transporter permease [Nakamurella sp. A5-74]|uniref:ABC transporter permease n=1 Tax=Nakamurella sp. A5-74 TaxID=3158264 RepID=A0AAU8DR79_9ACTN
MSETPTPTVPEAPSRPARSVDRSKVASFLQDNGVYVALAVLVGYNAFFTNFWFTASNLKLQLVLVAPILIVALGMALVIGTEGIDLSVGATMAISASVIGQGIDAGFSVPVIIVGVLLAGMLVGAIAGTLVAFFEVQPIVATLALLVAGRGIAVLLQASTLSVSDPTLLKFGSGSWLGIQAPFWDALVPVIIIAFVVRRTVFGRRIVVIGDNVRASYLSGIPVRRTLLTVYIVSGLLAAWAGLVVTTFTSTNDPSTNGLGYELFAITAVVVGGTALSGGRVRILGTIAGALVMQVLRSTLAFHNFTDAVTQMVTAVIIIVAVLVQRKRARS